MALRGLTLIFLLLLLLGFPGLKVQAVSQSQQAQAGTGGTENGNIVVYINWDGFASYYVDLAEQQGVIPTLTRLKNEEGVYFANAFTSIPSITDPMQVAIAAGTTPRFTDNSFRYFDKKRNRVIQENPSRKNEAETIAETAVRHNLEVLAINKFAFQNRGAVAGDPLKAYIMAPPGPGGSSDAVNRFNEVINIVKTMKSGPLTFRRIPRFIALYMDDLDGVGHNEKPHYGMKLAVSEAARRQAVVNRLTVMDAKLGDFIAACQTAGIYDQMSFVLTSDHGMAPFGLQQALTDDSRLSKLPALIAAIEKLGPGFKCEALHPDQNPTPTPGTDIALVTVGLQVQLSYVGIIDPGVIKAKNAKVRAALARQSYIGKVIDRDELLARGTKAGFADLVVSPKPPYHFHLSGAKLMPVRGQHDSLANEAQQIASFMWGKGIKKGFICRERVYNYDFAPTMTYLLGIDAPLDATGRVIFGALENAAEPMNQSVVTLEDTAAVLEGPVLIYAESIASGGTAAGLSAPMAALEFANTPAAQKLLIRYAASDNGKLALYVNGTFVREVFFPGYSGNGVKYEDKLLNLTLKEGDRIRLVNEPERGCSGVDLDSITFVNQAVLQE